MQHENQTDPSESNDNNNNNLDSTHENSLETPEPSGHYSSEIIDSEDNNNNDRIEENDEEENNGEADNNSQPVSFVDKILDILELALNWYKVVIPGVILFLALLQTFTYSISNFIGYLTTSLLLNVIVFIAGIITTLIVIYLAGKYFDFKNKNAEYTSSAAEQYYQKIQFSNKDSDQSLSSTSLDLNKNKFNLNFARNSSNAKNNSFSFKVQNNNSSSNSSKVHNSSKNPLHHSHSLKCNPQITAPKINFIKSKSTNTTTAQNNNPASASLSFSSQPFSSRARGIPLVNLPTKLNKPKITENNNNNNINILPISDDILPHITKAKNDPKSVWLTHLMKHLWREWVDSDKFYNGIRKKVLEEIRELLAKQTKLMGKDISVTDVVRSIDIHHIELGTVTPELTDFAHCYNDENRTCFEFNFTYDNKNKEKDSMYVEIDCDFVRAKQREMRFQIKLNLLAGRIKVCLERDPYSFWWFAFLTDPQIDLQIIQLPDNDNNNMVVKWFRDEFLVSRVKAIIRKHHKLPNHKVRTRPLIPDLSVNSVNDCGLPGLMGLLGSEVLPEYNIVEVEILEYSRFPLEFDRSSPEANCFVRYTIELITIEDGIKRNSDGFEIIDEENFEDCIVDNNNEMRSDSRNMNSQEHESEKSVSPDNSPVKITPKGSQESLVIDTEKITTSPTRSKIGRIKKAAFDHGLGLRRRNTTKTKSNSPRLYDKDSDNPETKSLNIVESSGGAIEAILMDQEKIQADENVGGFKNSFGHNTFRIQDNEEEDNNNKPKKYKSDFIIPQIKTNLPIANKWRQKHVIEFDPKQSGQFLRICFESMNQKTNFITKLGHVEIPIENIIALIKSVRSRTATRRFRVNKSKQNKIPKEFQTWKKLNCTSQRRFNEEFCYGDICIKFRVTSEQIETRSKIEQQQQLMINKNRNSSRRHKLLQKDKNNHNQKTNNNNSDTIGTVESAINTTMLLGDLTLKHNFIPISLKPFEVGKYICKVCKKRMFNPKFGQQRKCSECGLMIHERCQNELENQEFEFCEAKTNQLARENMGEAIDEFVIEEEEIDDDEGEVAALEQDTIVETLHQNNNNDRNSVNSLPISESSISVNLSTIKNSNSVTHPGFTSAKTKTDRQANMAKYLKNEFERRNLQSNTQRYAFIQNKIEAILDQPGSEREKEDDLTILQLFSMHYNVDHN